MIKKIYNRHVDLGAYCWYLRMGLHETLMYKGRTNRLFDMMEYLELLCHKIWARFF